MTSTSLPITRRRYLVAAISLSALMACSREGADSSQTPPSTLADSAAPADVKPTPGAPSLYASIGRPATRAEISAWDIDVNPTGQGLPPGHGSYAQGATLFAQKCAACHGTRGEGLATYPKLIGQEPRAGFPFGQDAKYVKTIGNYWPYATTLYDYIRRAMPLTAPGSLRSDEVYSLVAYLLAENGVTDRGATIDARSLPRIHMPAREHFVADNRTGGRVFR